MPSTRPMRDLNSWEDMVPLMTKYKSGIPSDWECVICAEGVKEEEECATLGSCYQHIFHRSCLLKSYAITLSCPSCTRSPTNELIRKLPGGVDAVDSKTVVMSKLLSDFFIYNCRRPRVDRQLRFFEWMEDVEDSFVHHPFITTAAGMCPIVLSVAVGCWLW